jgi:WD40 repeat protein
LKPTGEDKIIAYGCQKNLVIRNLSDPSKTVIYNAQVLNIITCAKYSANGNYLAYGDDKGGIRIIGWSNADSDWVIKYENQSMLNGAVSDLSWTDDHQKIVVVGAGGKRAAAVNIEMNNQAGELIGHNATLLCCDVKPKPYKLIVSGEDKEIQIYKGIPFKLEKSI